VTIYQHVIPHVADERQYQVRTQWTGMGWQVSIWDDKGRRIGPIYSVALKTPQEAEAYQPHSALEALIAIATSDLDSGRVKTAGEP
jgi:hypothetical protein